MAHPIILFQGSRGGGGVARLGDDLPRWRGVGVAQVGPEPVGSRQAGCSFAAWDGLHTTHRTREPERFALMHIVPYCIYIFRRGLDMGHSAIVLMEGVPLGHGQERRRRHMHAEETDCFLP